ncbi:MAG: beta-galactosidase, partial [bacterium]
MKKTNPASLFIAKVYCALTIILCVAPVISRAQVPDAGVYSIWPGNDSEILNLDHVKGGQVFTHWKDLEPDSGVYDWTNLDNGLALMNSLGVKASVQVNANLNDFPDWIFDSVAACTLKSKSRPNFPNIVYPQFWDPIFLDHTKRFINALAEHLKSSPYKDNVLLIRQNWNGVATEQYWLSRADQDPNLCTT